MKKRNVIILSIICGVLVCGAVFFFTFRNAIPSSRQQELDIYMPKFAPNEYINENSLTDSLSLRMYSLTEKEEAKVQADIAENENWHKFSVNDSVIIDSIPENSDTFSTLKSIDFNDCYIAVYNYNTDSFTDDADVQSFIASVYDEASSMYYYLEMIW